MSAQYCPKGCGAMVYLRDDGTVADAPTGLLHRCVSETSRTPTDEEAVTALNEDFTVGRDDMAREIVRLRADLTEARGLPMSETTREDAIELLAEHLTYLTPYATILSCCHGPDEVHHSHQRYEANRRATEYVDLLRESGLLNDQRYEPAGMVHPQLPGTYHHKFDGNMARHGWVPVYRKVDETP